MEKRAIVSAAGKKQMCSSARNNILAQARKLLSAVSPIYRVNPSMSQCSVRDIFTKKKGNEKCENMKK